jgi:hypothetical protein
MQPKLTALLVALLPLSSVARAQGPAAPPADPGTWGGAAEIAWYGTWEGGLAEAGASGRPILLQSAAPQCRGVPGMW